MLVEGGALRIAVEDEHLHEERAFDDGVGLVLGSALDERVAQRVAVQLAVGDLLNVPL
jgi:hypothetical protein